ncbi:MAG TPA: hypothetical protein VF399_05140 [bacterium]
MVDTGDIKIMDGLDCVAGNLLDRILASKGDLLMHEDFGAGFYDKVSLPVTEEKINDIVITVKHELLKDPRVSEVTEISAVQEQRFLYVTATLKLATGQVVGNFVFPFELESA